MCGHIILFYDSFIIFHVKNNAVQHAYYYHNTFAPHCFCGLTGREVFCAVMGVSRRFLVCLGVPGFMLQDRIPLSFFWFQQDFVLGHVFRTHKS